MRSFVFQRDNDPKHTAGMVSKWFANNKISILDWPTQISELNPIELFGDELDRRMKLYSPKNKKEL